MCGDLCCCYLWPRPRFSSFVSCDNVCMTCLPRIRQSRILYISILQGKNSRKAIDKWPPASQIQKVICQGQEEKETYQNQRKNHVIIMCYLVCYPLTCTLLRISYYWITEYNLILQERKKGLLRLNLSLCQRKQLCYYQHHYQLMLHICQNQTTQ